METTKTNKIKSLDGLKFIAVLAIFYWHYRAELGGYTFGIDMGRRFCEILFICSGFLIAYNSYKKYKQWNFKTQHTYVLKKYLKVWPLHIIMLIIFTIYMAINSNYFSKSQILPLISNIFLFNSWNAQYAMQVIDITWFLSCIMFCYYMAPLFLYIIDRIKVSFSTILFVVTFGIIVAFYVFGSKYGYQVFVFDPYTNPIIRCLEFALGIFMYPLFSLVNSKMSGLKSKNWFKYVWGIVEILGCVGWFFVCRAIGNKTDDIFIGLGCILVFLIALEGGVFSHALGCGFFRSLSKVQFDFYISHIVIGNITGSALKLFIPSVMNYPAIIFFARLTAVLVFCYLYRKFVAKWIDKFMLKATNKFFSLLKLNIVL